MQVKTLRSTGEPEKLVAQAARGDYYDGFVGDTSYEELMQPVSHDDSDVESVHELADFVDDDRSILDVGDQTAVADYSNRIEPEVLYKQYALLERLFRRGHWGPFEHPQITFAVEGVSRSCMAQLTRHRHATFDVQSQRYVDFGEKEDPVKVPKSLVDGDHFSRETGEVDTVERELNKLEYEIEAEDVVELYEKMVEEGVPKEDARFILPIGTKVNMTFSVNARMLLHVEDMRKKADAQWEIRELTEKIHDEFAEWMPMTAHLYEEHGPHKIAP